MADSEDVQIVHYAKKRSQDAVSIESKVSMAEYCLEKKLAYKAEEARLKAAGPQWCDRAKKRIIKKPKGVSFLAPISWLLFWLAWLQNITQYHTTLLDLMMRSHFRHRHVYFFSEIRSNYSKLIHQKHPWDHFRYRFIGYLCFSFFYLGQFLFCYCEEVLPQVEERYCWFQSCNISREAGAR